MPNITTLSNEELFLAAIKMMYPQDMIDAELDRRAKGE